MASLVSFKWKSIKALWRKAFCSKTQSTARLTCFTVFREGVFLCLTRMAHATRVFMFWLHLQNQQHWAQLQILDLPVSCSRRSQQGQALDEIQSTWRKNNSHMSVCEVTVGSQQAFQLILTQMSRMTDMRTVCTVCTVPACSLCDCSEALGSVAQSVPKCLSIFQMGGQQDRNCSTTHFKSFFCIFVFSIDYFKQLTMQHHLNVAVALNAITKCIKEGQKSKKNAVYSVTYVAFELCYSSVTWWFF